MTKIGSGPTHHSDGCIWRLGFWRRRCAFRPSIRQVWIPGLPARKIWRAGVKYFVAACILSLTGLTAFAAEPDGLVLPPGFHASIVSEGLGPMVRHLAFRDRNRLYVSTERQDKDAANAGIIALHLDVRHRVDRIEHFGAIDNGTGISFDRGALYAASAGGVYRFTFSGGELVPSAPPETVVDGVPSRTPLVFDGKGGLFLAVNSGSNFCVPANSIEGIGPVSRLPKDYKPVGPKPCPSLAVRGGVWRFDATRTGQNFLTAGEHFATGLRDINALAWSRAGNALYGVMYGRDGTHQFWPGLVSAAEDANVSDEMFHIVKGTDMGWPYTYYDAARHARLAAPEYGGDGKTPVTESQYATPAVAFPAHVAPQDIAFYDGRQFPATYRGGAFIAFHGAGGDLPEGHDDGYDVVFVPFDRNGKAGMPQVFCDGFAGPAKTDRNGNRAVYRPMGLAVGPDGALYVAESQKGRIWRISYGRN
jgi:glucose/arabinose dehydrogenase